MNVNGTGAQYHPAWQKAGTGQKNNSGVSFASRMADTAGTNTSESGRRTNAVFGRDNYVGGDAASVYGMGVYQGKIYRNHRT